MNAPMNGRLIQTGFGDCDPTGDEWLDDRADEMRDAMLGNQANVAELINGMEPAGISVGLLRFSDVFDALAWMLAHKDDALGVRCVLRAIDAQVEAHADRVCRDAIVEQAHREVAARMAEMKQDAEIDRRRFA